MRRRVTATLGERSLSRFSKKYEPSSPLVGPHTSDFCISCATKPARRSNTSRSRSVKGWLCSIIITWAMQTPRTITATVMVLQSSISLCCS